MMSLISLIMLANMMCAMLATAAVALATHGPAGEVIGATGRLGSLLIRSGGGALAAVPRDSAPGARSPPGSPIIVATQTSALDAVLRATPPERVGDLVLLCNGMARERVAEVLGAAAAARVTAGCVYFGVHAPGAAPSHGAGAPPTALAGPHAATLAALISRAGPRCVIVGDRVDALDALAQRKMLWSRFVTTHRGRSSPLNHESECQGTLFEVRDDASRTELAS